MLRPMPARCPSEIERTMLDGISGMGFASAAIPLTPAQVGEDSMIDFDMIRPAPACQYETVCKPYLDQYDAAAIFTPVTATPADILLWMSVHQN